MLRESHPIQETTLVLKYAKRSSIITDHLRSSSVLCRSPGMYGREESLSLLKEIGEATLGLTGPKALG